MSKYMVFDVESVGLHGEGFAVGYVVVDEHGKVHEEKLLVCPINLQGATPQDIEWVQKNVPQLPVGYTEAYMIRNRFWQHWLFWREKGATLWADCAWPVEANFLCKCVEDDPIQRAWEGPYPLHEIATLALACGHDPLATFERHENELPAHNPLKDAHQSARLLLEYLNFLNQIDG